MKQKWPRREKRHRGKCDYCHKRRIIGNRTEFCRECLIEWDRVVDKYFDGDPFYPLKRPPKP
jgi:hypothetical protein